LTLEGPAPHPVEPLKNPSSRIWQ